MVITMPMVVLFTSCTFAVIILMEILPPRGVEQITVIDLNEMLEGKKAEHQYIDVRSEEKFNELHVFGFRNIPLKDLKSNLEKLSKDRKVVVICERGNLGNEACRLLKREGFTDLANVRGGIITWESF